MHIDFAAISLDVLGIVLALSTGFYLYQTSRALRGDVMARGTTILTVAPFIIALSALLNLLDDFGVLQALSPIHYFTNLVRRVVIHGRWNNRSSLEKHTLRFYRRKALYNTWWRDLEPRAGLSANEVRF